MVNIAFRASVFMGGMAAEILLEAGKLALSNPLVKEAMPYAECASRTLSASTLQLCHPERLLELQRQLAAVSMVFMAAELAVLAGLVAFWWKYVRK